MRPSVQLTREFERIRDLPRRALDADEAATWAAVFTDEYRRPGSSAALRPWQGYCLAEAARTGGLFAGLPVGFGKTLLAELLPHVMHAQRPMLILPASLREKTFADRQALLRDWRLGDPPPRVTTMQEMAPQSGEHLLSRMRPDLIIIDEGDEGANHKSSFVRRIHRYVVAQQEAVQVVVMSGTPSRKSLRGYAHQLGWCLRFGAPVPDVEGELELWCAALDDYGLRDGYALRPHPGPLGRTLADARAWFGRRLRETPGVVIVDGDSAADVPLTIRWRVAKEDPILDAHYQVFLERAETPGGMPVSDPLSRWRFDAQLGTGLHLEYVVPPPETWRMARRDLAAFVRRMIDESTHAARPLDTEAQVIHRYPEHPCVLEWLRVRDTFEPETRAVWHSTSAIESALAWLRESDTPGVVWCGGVEFGEALSTAARLPYYGRKGQDASGRGLHNADPTRNLIASWHANKRGFNLQAWRRALIVQPPQSAKYLEQLIGRHHRSGQTQPITVDILITSGGTADAFDAAVSEARYAKATIGMTQKILRADIQRVTLRDRTTPANAFRWARREA